MSDFEYFTRLFDMIHINEIICIFLHGKNTYFSKSFYNNLTAKNCFIIIGSTNYNKFDPFS